MSRYDHLLELIDQHKPRTICEIGVWNGANAIRMINRAAQYHQNIEYIGFDLFEDATAETDATEFNVKSHNATRAVAAYIRSETPEGTSVMLVKGDTRQTLPVGTVRDFVFLDGGHSIETIRSDYERVCGSAVVVLDDYYTDGPDIKRFGCNSLVDGLTRHIEILNTKDPVKGGGYTQLVVICQQ
jgi:predicted O-methyltransferase YrrM